MSQVQRPGGLGTHAGETSLSKIVRFWTGAADAESTRQNWRKKKTISIFQLSINYIVAQWVPVDSGKNEYAENFVSWRDTYDFKEWNNSRSVWHAQPQYASSRSVDLDQYH
jgi:hypothetical protein